MRLNYPLGFLDLPGLRMQDVGGAVLITWDDPGIVHIAPLLIDPLAPPAPPPGILPNDAPLVQLRQVLTGAQSLYAVRPVGSDVHPPLIVAGPGSELYQLIVQ